MVAMPSMRARLAAARAASRAFVEPSSPPPSARSTPASEALRRSSGSLASPVAPRGLRVGRQSVRLEGTAAPVELHVRSDWLQSLTTLAGIASVLVLAAGLSIVNDANRRQTGPPRPTWRSRSRDSSPTGSPEPSSSSVRRTRAAPAG
jgi:hypothetical protein